MTVRSRRISCFFAKELEDEEPEDDDEEDEEEDEDLAASDADAGAAACSSFSSPSYSSRGSIFRAYWLRKKLKLLLK